MKELTIKEMAKMGGRASVKSRFAGKTKEEVSAIMKAVRLTPKDKETISKTTFEEQKTYS